MQRVVPVLLVALMAITPLTQAAPEPSVSSADDADLFIDITYSSTDSDQDLVSFTIRNNGNESLSIQSMQDHSEDGMFIECYNGCLASNLSPGNTRTVYLRVNGDQGTNEGSHAIQYPVRFANAPDATARIDVDVTVHEPGRLVSSLSLDDIDLPCPAPDQVSITGSIRLQNVGDESVRNIRLNVDADGHASSIESPPYSISAGNDASLDFVIRPQARGLGASIPVDLYASFTTTRSVPALDDRETIRLSPPSQLTTRLKDQEGTQISYQPGVLGLLTPHQVGLEFEELCGYQAIEIDDFDSMDNAVSVSPSLPWVVQPGEFTEGTLAITIPLSQLQTLCTGYSNTLEFQGRDEQGKQHETQVSINAGVDLGGTRASLNDLLRAPDSNAGTPDLRSNANSLGQAYLAILDDGTCAGDGGELRDVLATSTPLAWAWQLVDTGSSSEDVTAMVAMSQRLDGLCNDLSSSLTTQPCLAFSEQYNKYAEAKLQSEINQHQDRLDSTQRIQERVAALEFLVRAAQLQGDGEAERTWTDSLEEAQSQANAIRLEAIGTFLEQQSRQSGWVQDVTNPVAGDFKELDPISYALGEYRFYSSMARYDDALSLAHSVGDTSLQDTISQSKASLVEAHDASLGANIVMLAIYGVGLVAMAILMLARRVIWSKQRRFTELGDTVIHAH